MPRTLPTELYLAIIKNVDKVAGLKKLALSCRMFVDDAQSCLFSDCQFEATSQHDRQNGFFNAIVGKPRLGEFVRTLSIYHPPRPAENDLSSYQEIDDLAGRALGKMPNLKHLQLNWPNILLILQHRPYQLRTLFLGPLQSAEINFLLVTVLPDQTSLKSLEISDDVNHDIDTSRVPEGLCPSLEFLSAGTQTLSEILLERSVNILHLRWPPQVMQLPPLNPERLSLLKSLSLYIGPERRDMSFTSHLTALVDLRITVFWLHSELPDNLQFLQNLHNLKVLRWNVDSFHADISDEEFLTRFSLALDKAFELCPHLDHVEHTTRTGILAVRKAVRTPSGAGNGGQGKWDLKPPYEPKPKEWRYFDEHTFENHI